MNDEVLTEDNEEVNGELQEPETLDYSDDSTPIQEQPEIHEGVEVYDRFLTKSFDDYTVVEGFLLMFFVLFFCLIVIKIIKGAFQWLR